MEETDLFVELIGVDPDSGADTRIARCQSTCWHKSSVVELINHALDEGAKFAGAAGLEGLYAWNVTLEIGLHTSGIWPGFTLDVDTIDRISACNAQLSFDPYVENLPGHTCDHETIDNFTIMFTAIGLHNERVKIAIRGLRERSNDENIFILQVLKDALKYHNDNSLRKFRGKQPELTLYARYYQALTCESEGCASCPVECVRPGFFIDRDVFRRLNAANSTFRYCPFEKRRVCNG